MQPAQKPVTAASSASAATMPPSTAPSVVQPTRYATEAALEEAEPDHVREAWRAAVLERPFAEPRLQHLVVEDAGEAPPASRA